MSRMSIVWKTIVAGVWLAAIAFAVAESASAQSSRYRSADRVSREIFHEIVTLPYYGVFDHIGFSFDKGTVTLVGQVTRPTLKSDTERVMKDIQGVEQVINKIEVLPVSPNDDRLRLATYRAIYGHDALQRYAIQAMPSIHIIVKSGHITLVGWVASTFDKTIALSQARSVPGAFSVTDRMEVEPS
jgi:hyperosmotically inducible periplasmic protein